MQSLFYTFELVLVYLSDSNKYPKYSIKSLTNYYPF